MPSLILVGDVNLMNVDDPAVPFARVGGELRAADLVFANLECCLYAPPDGHTVEQEGFFADPDIAGEALKIGGIAAVGIANNVNYGSAAILGSIARLDAHGIVHTGAGENLAAARAPARAWQRRAPRLSSSAADYGSGFCSAARSTGRPIMRRRRMAPALRHCAVIPPTRCRRTRRAPKSRR